MQLKNMRDRDSDPDHFKDYKVNELDIPKGLNHQPYENQFNLNLPSTSNNADSSSYTNNTNVVKSNVSHVDKFKNDLKNLQLNNNYKPTETTSDIRNTNTNTNNTQQIHSLNHNLQNSNNNSNRLANNPSNNSAINQPTTQTQTQIHELNYKHSMPSTSNLANLPSNSQNTLVNKIEKDRQKENDRLFQNPMSSTSDRNDPNDRNDRNNQAPNPYPNNPYGNESNQNPLSSNVNAVHQQQQVPQIVTQQVSID